MTGAATARPVVFIHGLWLHAASWQPWVELFRAEGYSPVAPGWPGDPGTVEDARAHAEVDTANQSRGPLLLIAGGRDDTVPETITRATLKQYRHSDAVTDFLEFPDRGHSLSIDSGWREVADASLAWLRKQGL